MKLAFLSDIHANLPALEAILEDIDRQAPDFVYCLGDIVGYNIWPNEVIQELRKRRIPTLAGNYDEAIGNHWEDCGCGYTQEQDKALAALSVSFTNSIIRDEERAYLRMLPRHMSLTFQADGDMIRLLMVHGSPRKINESLFEDRPEKSLNNIFEFAQADIIVCGHTHIPYHRILRYAQNGATKYRHVINSGAVGRPNDEDPRAGYVILHLDGTFSLTNPESIEVEFRRIGYDVEKAANAVEDSILPDDFAEIIRKGKR